MAEESPPRPRCRPPASVPCAGTWPASISTTAPSAASAAGPSSGMLILKTSGSACSTKTQRIWTSTEMIQKLWTSVPRFMNQFSMVKNQIHQESESPHHYFGWRMKPRVKRRPPRSSHPQVHQVHLDIFLFSGGTPTAKAAFVRVGTTGARWTWPRGTTAWAVGSKSATTSAWRR